MGKALPRSLHYVRR